MLAVVLAASAAVALHAPVLERPSAAKIAAAPAVIPDSTLSAPKARRVLKLGNYWGGKYSTATG